jgi:tRNA1(Val) A37 N6-methylase TrmN6
MSDLLGETTEDAFLGGALRLRQPKSGHRAGHDAMLLAAATLDLVLVEIDPGLARLARDNAAANNMSADVAVLDVIAPAETFSSAGLPPDTVDVVLMNPPFNDAARHRASPDRVRAAAHVATDATLENWIHAARRILKSSGALTLIWRADGLADVLAALERGFGSLKILPVHADASRPAIRVLVRAVKGGKAPTEILSAVVLNDEQAAPNRKVGEILEGRGVLPLAIPQT